ncbi:peptidyl-prolyl cis-trans isomerase SurA [Terrimicrobium sacchariphilum]|uniref:peptidylprolyl isomerase n=1 Tax=Terrimicrobium sacchariphilum TaxID=690879 RepID=A0A146G9H9_TERSA|nr:peptidyl-prolyl cis-trans isomerase [Terrimicrobium sacchariphilum]GAT33933.1 peptidyl-prolyl cis-trans isomerase SurA [Terrimicrobium sacchariphilum]
MKHFVVFSVALLIAGIALAQKAEVIDGIAALVNNDVVTISQVRELVGARERSLRQLYSGNELRAKLEEVRLAAIKDLIDRQLILQEFKKLQEKGASIPDYVIDDRVQTIIREEFGGDRSAFIRTLQAQGYTLTRFKEIEREKIIVQAMRQSKVNNDFVISPTQIQAYYNKNKMSYATPEQVKLRMIVIREENSSDVASTDKQGIAKEIRDKIAGGAEFDRMAQMYSEDPNTQEVGGDWGWIERGTLNEQLTSVAFSLRPGEVSPVVQIGGTYYILMIEAKKNAAVKPISDVRDEIERNLIQQERMKSQERWLDTLRQKAYIKILS